MERERVTVVTDSAASLPQEVASDLGIEVVPIYLRFGDETLRDEGDPADFYGRLRSDPEGVGTASPAPGDFTEAFDRAPGEEIVCVTVAARVSAINQTARLAAEMSDKRVEVVDSGNASMAQGFVALEAARAGHDGASLEETAGRARDVAERVVLVAALRKLPPAQRRALVLHYLADLSIADIAAESGVAEGTVKSWLHRGRVELARHLVDFREGEQR